MRNFFALPTIRWIQRFSMVLTLGCIAYIVFTILIKGKDRPIAVISRAPSKNLNQLPPQPVFDVKPFEVNDQTRDIFSLNTDVTTAGTVVNTPKGQLPEHLKVVGIVIAHPSQIIIEDSAVRKTYFIDEGVPQAGIKIMSVDKAQMIINYQGQNISVPVGKS